MMKVPPPFLSMKTVPKVSAIIVAAGKGARMAAPVRKQYLELAGRSIISHTLFAFDRCREINEIFLVVPESDFEFCRKTILCRAGLSREVVLVPGGERRQDSVYSGLGAVDNRGGIVVIHDGVRPFVRPEQIARCVDGAVKTGACILAVRDGSGVPFRAVPSIGYRPGPGARWV